MLPPITEGRALVPAFRQLTGRPEATVDPENAGSTRVGVRVAVFALRGSRPPGLLSFI